MSKFSSCCNEIKNNFIALNIFLNSIPMEVYLLSKLTNIDSGRKANRYQNFLNFLFLICSGRKRRKGRERRMGEFHSSRLSVP